MSAGPEAPHVGPGRPASLRLHVPSAPRPLLLLQCPRARHVERDITTLDLSFLSPWEQTWR